MVPVFVPNKGDDYGVNGARNLPVEMYRTVNTGRRLLQLVPGGWLPWMQSAIFLPDFRKTAFSV